MKKLMYIFLILPLIMSGCKGKKETERGGMSTPEISVAYPLVQNITLTKDYPGYLTTEQTVNLVARVNGALQSASFTPGTRVKQGQLLFVIEPTIDQFAKSLFWHPQSLTVQQFCQKPEITILSAIYIYSSFPLISFSKQIQ